MNNFVKSASVFLLTIVATVSCETIDAERARLHGTLNAADMLASEIGSWSEGVQTATAPDSLLSAMESFQDRAENLLDELEDYSETARRGTDVTAVANGLREITNFSTDNFRSATEATRRTLVDQFSLIAQSLDRAVQQVDRDGFSTRS